jgi:hypothetical protein
VSDGVQLLAQLKNNLLMKRSNKMALTKRGNFVVGFTTGALVALTLNYTATHHTVIDTKSCHYQFDIEKTVCNFHYERNK